MREIDPTGISKTVTQSSIDEERRAAEARDFAKSKAEGEIARVKFKAEHDQWIGKNSDDLVMKWGKPYDTYQRDDKGKHLIFRKETLSLRPMIHGGMKQLTTIASPPLSQHLEE